jgi:hypothetical protein
MPSTLITAYLGQGLASARPATPAIATGTIGFYEATDTGALSVYANGAWSNVGGIDKGVPPSVVQSKLAVANSASITLTSAPVNGNLLVAMCFNPTVGTVGSGWTQVAANSTGADFGLIAIKTAGASESATQSPLSGAGNGVIAMWEIHAQAVAPVITAATQAEQASLQSNAPSTPNLKNAITLGCVSLVSTSNNISALYNMTQDQIVATGTTRQGVMGHSFADTPVGQPLAVFSGTGTPSNKSGIITITA